MSPTGFSLTGPRGGLRPSATPLSSPRLGDRGAPPGTTALERCARGAPQEQPRTVGVGVLSHSQPSGGPHQGEMPVGRRIRCLPETSAPARLRDPCGPWLPHPLRARDLVIVAPPLGSRRHGASRERLCESG